MAGFVEVSKREKLRLALMPTLEKLYRQDPESLPFRQPVDPVALQIPDYHEIIHNPMDLSTIKRKLDTGQYKDPWEYVDDVWLMLDNAWVYNKKSSGVYKYSTKLSEVFEQEINSVMQSLGYCCGIKQSFSPQVLCCAGSSQCFIPQNATFFNLQAAANCSETDRQENYRLCEKCFMKIPGDFVEVKLEPELIDVVPKSQFTRMKNNQKPLEPFVSCKECGRKFHKICVLHFEPIWKTGFICENCLKAKGARKKKNRYTAKRLPGSELGTYLEHRINTFLKKKDAGADKVYIKVLSSSEKSVQVQPGMKAKFTLSGEYPERFSYTAKSLFAFQKRDGCDICFFGLHVQEYGSECPQPNPRRVYISYLDSVHFFQPRHLKTAVYHEILIGYLEYVKSLGYVWAHIWVCPPRKGDDYIFNCHPKEQKTPSSRRLLEWYKQMLGKAWIEGVILEYKDMYQYIKETGQHRLTDVPYFHEDFWPRKLEEILDEVAGEREKRQRRLTHARAYDDTCDCCSTTDQLKHTTFSAQMGRYKSRRGRKRRALSQAPGEIISDDQEMEAKLLSSIEKQREGFIVARLQSAEDLSHLPPIRDPDPSTPCALMDGRDAFLIFMRDRYHEFSSLRRAKYSSLALLYELHNQGSDLCDVSMETDRQEFDAINSVMSNSCDADCGEDELPDLFASDCTDYSPSGLQHAEKSEKTFPQTVQRCAQWLAHAIDCTDQSCQLSACSRMKRLTSRAKVCEKTTCKGCSECRLLLTLCCVHAKYCTETSCPVPFCPQIVQKIAKLKISE